jgi:hydroxymethylpyrimidine pyrophosphatase-like HAD family hydrolase
LEAFRTALQYRLIALDLDGTLLSSGHEVTPRTREALRAARERGIVAVIATGRTCQSARQFSRLIGGGPIICCNGASVLDETGAVVVQKAIPPAPLRRCLEICTEAKLLVECYTPRGIVLDRPVAHMGAFLRWVRPAMGPVKSLFGVIRTWHVNRVRPVFHLVKWSERRNSPPVLKLMLIGAAETLATVAERIRREAPGVEVTTSGPDNLEIMAGGVSKGYGLQQLGARLRIPREAMLAFGDSENDLEMLRYAGVGVAMGNGRPAVKAAADRIAPACYEDGVARIIEEMCLT